jgi:hypothetical protein
MGTGGSEGMTLPSKLLEYGECWQDAFPLPVCETVPELDPPIIEWSCDDEIAAIRIPPQSCMVAKGRFSNAHYLDSTCDAATTGCTDHPPTCIKVTNADDGNLVRYLHRPKSCTQSWTVSWYPIEQCPNVSCN